MRTERKKTFWRPFLLDEQALRRIDTCISEETQNIAEGQNWKRVFTVRLRGGSIIETEQIGDVLFEDNTGSRTPEMVKLTGQSSEEEPLARVTATFEVADDEEDRPRVSYAVRGNNRDPVLVSADRLEERVSRTLRGGVLRSLLRLRTVFIVGMFTTLVMFIGVLVLGFGISSTRYNEYTDGLSQIRQAWASDTLSDPVEAVIRIAELRISGYQRDIPPLWMAVGFPLLLVAGAFLLAFRESLLRLVVCGFAWGDNGTKLQGRMKTWGYIWWFVILAFIIAVLAGLFVKYM